MSLKTPTKTMPNIPKSSSKVTKKRKAIKRQADLESDDSDEDLFIKSDVKTRSQAALKANDNISPTKPTKRPRVAHALLEFEQRWGASSSNGTDLSSNDNAATSSDLVLVGRLFTITAGSGNYKRTYTVELEAFGALSDVLYKHTHNEMKEGLEGTMVLEEFYPETMVRLFAWGKVGYYPSSQRMDIPKYAVKRLKHPGAVIKKQTYYALRESVPVEEVEELFKKSSNDTAIIHERVYILADRFNIKALKAYSLRKIRGLHSKFIKYIIFPTKPIDASKRKPEKVKPSKCKAKDPSSIDKPSEGHQKMLAEIISMVQLGYDYLCPVPLVPLSLSKGGLTNNIYGADVSQRFSDLETTTTTSTSTSSTTGQNQEKSLSRTEPLLQHLSEVTSLHLHYLRAEEEFVSLLKSYPDFAASVLMVPPLSMHCKTTRKASKGSKIEKEKVKGISST